MIFCALNKNNSLGGHFSPSEVLSDELGGVIGGGGVEDDDLIVFVVLL